MLDRLLGKVTLVRAAQLSNNAIPKLVMLLGSVTLSNDMQLRNTTSPMLVTLLGMVMLVKEEQPSKTQGPTLVMLLGRVTLVRDVHPPNALNWILVTGHPASVDGIVTSPPEPTYPVMAGFLGLSCNCSRFQL